MSTKLYINLEINLMVLCWMALNQERNLQLGYWTGRPEKFQV